MAEYLNQIVEDDTVTCEGCNKVFRTDELTLDDWEFAWDGITTIDCCNDCYHKFKVPKIDCGTLVPPNESGIPPKHYGKTTEEILMVNLLEVIVKLLEREVVMNQDVMRAIEKAKSDVRLHSSHYDMLRGRLNYSK